LGGLTFSKTPAYNYTSLQEAPLSFYDQYGDDRNTTYSSDTVAAPAWGTKYARVRGLAASRDRAGGASVLVSAE
jgi:hypothetical protein